MSHTPTPWTVEDTFKVFASGKLLASCGGYVAFPGFNDEEKEANAEFIVTACNAYEALVEAGEEMVRLARETVDDRGLPHIFPGATQAMEEALKLAEEKS